MRLGNVDGLFRGGVATFLAPDGGPMTSGIRKAPIAQARFTIDGAPGDASAEKDHHTPERAVHLFASDTYDVLEEHLSRSLPRPAFGENIVANGISDDAIFVGDHLRVGTALLVVTQPTERCKAIGRSLGFPKILKALHQLEVCGFYARVEIPGEITVGDAVFLEHRFEPAWSVKRLHRAMFKHHADEELISEVMALANLSSEWKARLDVMRGRAKRGEPMSSNLVDL